MNGMGHVRLWCIYCQFSDFELQKGNITSRCVLPAQICRRKDREKENRLCTTSMNLDCMECQAQDTEEVQLQLKCYA